VRIAAGFSGLRQGLEVKVSGFLQIREGLFLSATLAGSADFGALGHKQIGF
jgi:hypothetical protein